MRTPRFGVGFRTPYAGEIAQSPRALDWLEIVSENFLGVGGPRRAELLRLRADYPVLMHGVALGIAGTDPFREDHLRGLRDLAAWLEPEHVSDHLCWTSLRGHESHDLLPIAYTREVLERTVARVLQVQDFLGRRLLLENATAYVAFRGAELEPGAFFAELWRRTGCGVLLDVNNLYVDAMNLGVDPERFLDALPREAVGYLHLAGHDALADVRIDTHGADVPPEVFRLFEIAARRFPDAGVILERDDNLPPFAGLVAEVEEARRRHAAALAAPASDPAPPRAPAACAARHDAWRAQQELFFGRLVDRPVGADHARDPSLRAVFDDRLSVRAARGMRVYSDGYALSLRRALATNYPALARVLHPDDFAALAAAYLRAHPPRTHEFRSLGAELAEFVRRRPPARDYGAPPTALADLVALEHAELEVQNAPDELPGVSPGDLEKLRPDEWPEARFALARALRIVHAAHDVLPVVDAVARGERAPRPAPGSATYLVFRSGAEVRTRRIDAAEARALESLRRGERFEDACAAAGDIEAAARALVAASTLGLVVARL